jgi:hypothetical protein
MSIRKLPTAGRSPAEHRYVSYVNEPKIALTPPQSSFLPTNTDSTAQEEQIEEIEHSLEPFIGNSGSLDQRSSTSSSSSSCSYSSTSSLSSYCSSKTSEPPKKRAKTNSPERVQIEAAQSVLPEKEPEKSPSGNVEGKKKKGILPVLPT